MTIEHNTIGAGELHEPKGAAGASADEIYVADGVGSGSFSIPEIENMSTSTANVGETFIADGSGGGSWKLEQAYGEMQILQNSTAIALTAAVDGSLYTTSDYTKITGIWAAGVVDGITYATDELTVPTTGVYHLAGWANTQSSVNNVLVGVKYAVNGTVLPSAVAPTLRRKIGTGTDIGAVSGIGLVQLTAGDVVSLYVACDSNANITIPDAGISLHLVKS